MVAIVARSQGHNCETVTTEAIVMIVAIVTKVTIVMIFQITGKSLWFSNASL